MTVERKSSGLLFPIFVILLVLKLAGYTTMSWWIVTLPLWLPVVILIPMVVFVAVCVTFKGR